MGERGRGGEGKREREREREREKKKYVPDGTIICSFIFLINFANLILL